MPLPTKGIAAPTAPLSGAGLRVCLVRTRWNPSVVNALASGARRQLAAHGVEDIQEVEVPGAYELPLAAKLVLARGDVDAVICIGCLIKGDTMHFEYICEAVTQGIMRVQLDTGRPVIFGVLCVLNEEQALLRAGIGPAAHNHGEEWATAAVQMAALSKGGA